MRTTFFLYVSPPAGAKRQAWGRQADSARPEGASPAAPTSASTPQFGSRDSRFQSRISRATYHRLHEPARPKAPSSPTWQLAACPSDTTNENL